MTIKKIPAYECSDGSVHTVESSASAHEAELDFQKEYDRLNTSGKLLAEDEYLVSSEDLVYWILQNRKMVSNLLNNA